MEDLILKENSYHAISFETSEHLTEFRQLLSNYFKNRNRSDVRYIDFIDDNRKSFKHKEFSFLNFDCNTVQLEAEKATKKIIQDNLFYQLENNPQLVEEYMGFQQSMDYFLSNIGLGENEIDIQFYYTDKTIQRMLKSLEISVEFEEKSIPNFKLRHYLIRVLIQMAPSNRKNLLLLSYPETDIGWQDINEAIAGIRKLGITTIVLSTNAQFLTAAEEQNMFLVDKNGKLYDTINLRKELEAFSSIEEKDSKPLAKDLAIYDFKEDYNLLNENLKEFLLSNRF